MRLRENQNCADLNKMDRIIYHSFFMTSRSEERSGEVTSRRICIPWESWSCIEELSTNRQHLCFCQKVILKAAFVSPIIPEKGWLEKKIVITYNHKGNIKFSSAMGNVTHFWKFNSLKIIWDDWDVLTNYWAPSVSC